MSLQQELLPRLVETCAALHPECSVVRIGSVARGKERADSDIDLNVILPGGEIPSKATAYIGDDNRWQLRLKDEVEVIRIDVAWETQNALVERLRGAAAVGCWPFSQGHVCDPNEIAGPCLELARQWFASRPGVSARFEAEFVDAKVNTIV